jgi:ceramide glucosyltransferase
MEDVLSGQGLREMLARDLRWCRTTRVSRPAGHFGLAFTFGTSYALLYAIATVFSPAGLSCLGAVLAIRILTASVEAVPCMGDRDFFRRIWLLPLRDVLSFCIWIAGYAGRQVMWRGRKLRVLSDGMISDISTR